MSNINEIILQVKQLDKEDQLNLLGRLVLLIRKEQKSKSEVKLSSISGLGADIWSGKDIDQFVESEREW